MFGATETMSKTISTEEKLKERIKELTCLFNVSSIIANSNYSQLDKTLTAIALSIKKALRYPDDASVEIKAENLLEKQGNTKNKVFTICAIQVFNEPKGYIKIGYPEEKYTQNAFFEEEKQLLSNTAAEIGNLLEKKQVIENERKTQRQLERVDRLHILGEITAGIAHELNTPLAGILGFSELLQETLKDNVKAKEDLEKITNSAIYCREVVKKLMFFSCEMPQYMKVQNIVPIIRDGINLLKPNFSKKSLTHNFTHNKEEIFLRVDNIQLTQVVFNIIINAIYFSPEKGHIDIAVKDLGNKVEITISDEGKGIKNKNSEAVFNPFFTTKEMGKGTGLGLSVVHGIIASHNGTISHRPNRPKGTVFTITIPKSDLDEHL